METGMYSVMQGLSWMCKLGRCGLGRGARGSRGGLILLLTGVLFSLLLLALTPHPTPAEPLHRLRRIHQEEEDYTGGKAPPPDNAKSPPVDAAPARPVVNSLGGLSKDHISAPPPPPPPSLSQSAAKPSNQSQPSSAFNRDVLAVFSKLAQAPPRTHEGRVQLARVQEAALTALNYGYKLTKAQQAVLNNLNPQARRDLEDRLAKTRQAQDRVYLSHLRTRGQVLKRAGGGEEVVSTAKQVVRFPIRLKKIPPAQWPDQYKLYYNLTHYPWVKSEGCKNFRTSFALPGSLPPRGLASFPSSGNTWVRYLIEGATGIFTGSMYDDTSLMRKGLYGEGVMHDSGMTIVQKSHGYTTGEAMTMQDKGLRAQHNHLQELGYQGVVVIRNPFKALISHRHLDVGGHTGYAPKAHFLGQGWADFVTLKVHLWRDFYTDWLRLTSPEHTYVMHYEDLCAHPVEEMRGVLRHLNMPEDSSRLACLGKNLDGMFKRKPSKNSPLNFDPFTKELRAVIYESINAVDLALRERGKSGLPVDKYEIYDAKEAEGMGYGRTVSGGGGGGGG